MSNKQKMEYRQLETGFEFPLSQYRLEPSTVAAYLRAVEETSALYHEPGLVPPTAIAAYAMAALAESIVLPPGTIHVSQELEFLNPVKVNDTITTHATVSRKQSRGKFHFLNVDLNVLNQQQEAVLLGRTSFILPDENGGQ